MNAMLRLIRNLAAAGLALAAAGCATSGSFNLYEPGFDAFSVQGHFLDCQRQIAAEGQDESYLGPDRNYHDTHCERLRIDHVSGTVDRLMYDNVEDWPATAP
jgi:hypothetical protein